MQTAEARVAFIVRGVVQQAMRDAGVAHVQLVGQDGAQRELVTRWCDVAYADNARTATISLSSANKTELLLGRPERADVYPLGDLYASEVEQFCGSFDLTDTVEHVAQAAGGVAALDEALRRLLDERREPGAAFAHSPQLRDDVLRLLNQNRFFRMHMGVVPKIGARTIGIDLFI